jgi:hypothetical protein
LTFYPAIKKPGIYTLYFYCTQLPSIELPNLLYLNVQDENGIQSVSIVPEEHRGSWVKLGTYAFDKQSSVTVNGESTKGPVFADAILLIPKVEH